MQGINFKCSVLRLREAKKAVNKQGVDWLFMVAYEHPTPTIFLLNVSNYVMKGVVPKNASMHHSNPLASEFISDMPLVVT